MVGQVISGERMALLGISGSRFAVPVSDTDEVALRESAVPSNTKVTTEWGDLSLERVLCTKGYMCPRPMDSEVFQS